MVKEITLRSEELSGEVIESVYFGGGTPSLLTNLQMGALFKALEQQVNLSQVKEITLEANPEDINIDSLAMWKSMGINRLSIGIQSLNEIELEKMNRNHNAEQSKMTVKLCLEAGFDLLTLDLIYGSPWKSNKQWEAEIDWALNSGINHLSAYALTIEPKTVLSHKIKTKKEIPPVDETTIEQFQLLQDKIDASSWKAYEISNYCKPGSEAVHNSNYWAGKKYIGIGPSAHSFNGQSRRWNIANNTQYIQLVQTEEPYFETEILTQENRANELIMTQLRRSIGLNMNEILIDFPNWRKSNSRKIESLIIENHIILKDDFLMLTNSGKLISDYIISELMI